MISTSLELIVEIFPNTSLALSYSCSITNLDETEIPELLRSSNSIFEDFRRGIEPYNIFVPYNSHSLIKQFGSLRVDFFFFPHEELQNFALQEYEVKLSNERAFKGILMTL